MSCCRSFVRGSASGLPTSARQRRRPDLRHAVRRRAGVSRVRPSSSSWLRRRFRAAGGPSSSTPAARAVAAASTVTAPTSGPGRARGSRRARQRRPADPSDPSGGRYGRGGRSGGPARPGAVAPVRPHPAREGCGKRGQQVRRVAGSAGGRRAVPSLRRAGRHGQCHDLSPRTFPTPKSRSIVAPREEGEEPPRLRGHR